MDLCIVFGPLISIAVGILKKIPFVGKNPKVIAAVLSLVVTVLGSGIIGGGNWKLYLTQIIACVLATFGTAVATHEVLLKPLRETFGKQDG